MILTVGLTPAWQRVMRFSAVQLGEINRTAEVVCCAAGKAVNAARALGLLGAPHHALSFAGGPTGEALQRDLAARLVVHTLVPTTEATRTCTTLLDNATGSVTELVEEAGPLSSHELEQFCAAYRALAPRASIIVLSGSLPPDCSTELYRELLTHAGSTPTVVDAHGPALLAALAQRPTFVKPNRQELGRTLGRELADDAALRRAMHELNQRGARWVVVSDGPRTVWISGKSGSYRCAVPPVPVVNTIGSGDSLAAGIACGLQRGLRSLEAIRFGVAAAVANVGTLLPAEIDPARVEALVATLRLD
ncbi:MAG: hexose kinase [Proteobacteria bacterium]|nr:hexose kinase [Pseudomonadota bacterium]